MIKVGMQIAVCPNDHPLVDNLCTYQVSDILFEDDLSSYILCVDKNNGYCVGFTEEKFNEILNNESRDNF